MTQTHQDVEALSVVEKRVVRIEVRSADASQDALARDTQRRASEMLTEANVSAVKTAQVTLIESTLPDDAIERIANELLCDPVGQAVLIGTQPVLENDRVIEVHFLPGVMDPVALSTESAIAEMLGQSDMTVSVRTGVRYDLTFEGDLSSEQSLERFAYGTLANAVVQEVRLSPWAEKAFLVGQPYEFSLQHVSIRDLDDDGLKTLSRQGHLFLSLEEMQAIQSYYQQADRDPTDIELETLAQTWSEHCVHKTLRSTVRYTGPDAKAWSTKPGHELNEDGTLTIHNLLKSTVAAATHELRRYTPHDEWLVSVFDDNAGIVRFDHEDGIAIKVETHNHPSALEPYGGAATGIGGCLRDIMGTGLAAKPIANTDVFCVATPRQKNDDTLPAGVLPPERILERVVAGVRDYGNRMGVPTVNGAVMFDESYLGNPLVYAGCVGIIPLDKAFGDAQPGDHIIALGGHTGRDGVHGATFSSAELTDTHADEFSHAVQIGNAITQKKTLDVILQARDMPEEQGGCLFSAITDCGAGGFSSAIGEMGEKVGADVHLDRAPLKYDGLTYTEVWISEAQERMVLSVPPAKLDQLKALCDAEDVTFADLGTFGLCEEPDGSPTLKLHWHGQEVGRLPMSLMHDGLPMPTRDAVWDAEQTSTWQYQAPTKSTQTENASTDTSAAGDLLHRLLSHPSIASKHWIIRQYDHEVQGGSVIKPLTGPKADGPSDAAVLRPKLTSRRGIALGCGAAPSISEQATARGWAVDGDSYFATVAAVDEAVRNLVCTGADPARLAILDNFCWPSCNDANVMGTLVRAAEACYDAALAYASPFVSGKDSLNNQFTTDDGQVIAIAPTLLITGLGIVNDVARCVTMDAKAAGQLLLLVGQTESKMGGAHLLRVCESLTQDADLDLHIPRLSLDDGPRHARAVASLIDQGWVAAAHDCSEGGLLVAAAEMAFAGRVGLDLDFGELPDVSNPLASCFAETPARYLLAIDPKQLAKVQEQLDQANVGYAVVGQFADHDRLTESSTKLDESLDALRTSWLNPLDW